MLKTEKGSFGYLSQKKKTEAIKTLILFAIPLALFIAGLIATGTRRNLLTIIAVLGFLPASKYAVLLIMYLKSHGIGAADHEIVESALQKHAQEDGIGDELIVLYDLVFTTQEHTYEVPAMYLYGGSACGYLMQQKSRDEKTKKKKDAADLSASLEKHLTNCLKKDGQDVNVKIFESFEIFTRRLVEQKPLEKADVKTAKAIRRVLFQVSL